MKVIENKLPGRLFAAKLIVLCVLQAKIKNTIRIRISHETDSIATAEPCNIKHGFLFLSSNSDLSFSILSGIYYTARKLILQ